MENYTQSTVVIPNAEETHHKKASTAMVLSIIGLALFILPGLNLVGIVLSIIGFVQSVNNRRFAAENAIKEDSQNAAGYVCGLIGIIAGGLSVLALIVIVLLVIVAGISFLTYAAPAVGATITESAPYIEDALESALPGVMSRIAPFLSLL